jgi:hypothetical protein
MTTGDDFSALRDATAQLIDPAQHLTALELMAIDQSSYPHMDALINAYVHAQKPASEFEEQLWQTVEAYLQQMNSAYTHALQEPMPKDGELARQLLQRRMEALGLLAYCNYLRYQPLPENFWTELHGVYQMAEQAKEVAAGTSCDAGYLQALMLGTVNRTNMLKWEIALVNHWLGAWSKALLLAREYDETQHLFFVDLLADRGARRARGFAPGPNYLYWHVDVLTDALEAMRQQLNNNVFPADFTEKTSVINALGLVERLLAEWSYADYRRQRRDEERAGVSKSAQVVHGIFNVCQHVKNLAFATTEPMAEYPQQGSGLEAGDEDTNHWVIENESTFGFGASVKSRLNLWLKPGRLIALDYEFNPDMTVVGVVRSIQQQFEDDCYVGIEVLSHTPSYVRLTRLADVNKDISNTDAEPFSALYLAKDDDREQSASLVMPAFEYVQSGYYELKLQQRILLLQLGNMIEQRDDWLRAELKIIDKST